MSAAVSIEWLTWSDEAFARAEALQRPILLRIGASWCNSCAVMAEESDVDPVVVSAINERFVPVYVDSDRRPDINERYSLGGWPTNAFLTPRGELITGGTYFDIGTFRLLLERVSHSWSERRDEVLEAVESIRRDGEQRRRAKPLDVVPSFGHVERIVDLAMDEFDFRYGGFGREPKFPHPATVELLLAEYRRTGEERLREAALISLEAISEPAPNRQRLAAPDGGFFRYAGGRDWSDPRFEKTLEDHAHLLSVFLSAHQLTAEARWAQAARSILMFVRGRLFDPKRRLFKASQTAVGADAYYALDKEARGKAEPPVVDATVYIGPNAAMASALVKAGLALGEDSVLEFGAAIVDGLLASARMDDDLLFGHVLGTNGVDGPVLLSNQVHVARALVDAYEALGGTQRLTEAASILDEVHARLHDSVRQAYTDTIVDPGGEGYLSQPIVPLVENCIAVDTLFRLASLLDAPTFHARGVALLRAIAGTIDNYGFVAAPFALSVLRSLTRDPISITIAALPHGGDVRPLARAAHALYAPFKCVRFLDPERDHAQTRRLRPLLEKGPLAIVTHGAAPAESATNPEQLVALLARYST